MEQEEEEDEEEGGRGSERQRGREGDKNDQIEREKEISNKRGVERKPCETRSRFPSLPLPIYAQTNSTKRIAGFPKFV